jgi:hypothetical protein
VQTSFDLLSGSVVLRILPHREGVERLTFQPAPVRQGVRDGVRSHREATHVRDGMTAAQEGVPTYLASEELALGAHGGASSVDVIRRTSATREGKIACPERSLHEKHAEIVTMVHAHRLPERGHARQGLATDDAERRPGEGPLRGRRRLALLAVILLSVACGDAGPAGPDALRFGQIGRIRVDLAAPLGLGQGQIHQVLTWESTGPWELREAISYAGFPGDEDVRRSGQLPEVLAGSYATWIAQVNDLRSLSLFVEELEADGSTPSDLECGANRSRVVLTIRDSARGEEMSWTRCVMGRLETLTESGAGPDAAAGRVAAAAILAREYALRGTFQSAYAGSVPFGTIERGEDSGAEPSRSQVFISQAEWSAFWTEHRPTAAVPSVDFGSDMVILAAVGQRSEAGDSVEIRRVLPVGDSTFVVRVERVPGDFCSPAQKLHYPYHLVVVPDVPLPVRFVEPVEVERVPCGG